MLSSNRIAIIVALCATLAGARHLHLDDNYMVDVDIKNDTIELTLTVTTTGWVGFGVNTHPNMSKADLFIGGVHNATSKYFGDYHGQDGNGKPTRHANGQDWMLDKAASSEQNGNTRILKVTRKLDTNNTEEDIKIENNESLYVLWSYSNNTDDVETGHVNRGNKKLSLFTADDSAGGDSSTALVSCFSTLVMGLIVSLYRN